VTALDRRSIARHIAVVPQVFETLFPFTVREIVALGALDPEAVVTPGIYVKRVVHVPNPIMVGVGTQAAA